MYLKLAMASCLVLGLSGCYDSGIYEREGAKFQQDIASLAQADLKSKHFTNVASDAKGFPGPVFVPGSPLAVSDENAPANVPLSNVPEKSGYKSAEHDELGPLKPYNPPEIKTSDLDKGFHQQQLRDMDQRAQENLLINERRIQR